MTLDLLVLRCRDIEKTRAFYTQLGLIFEREQHGNSPVHYSAHIGSMLLELYPATGEPDNVRLGFVVSSAILAHFGMSNHGVIRDPDGRGVELSMVG